jgi:nitroimidazol reductase NimA-like FMN-containing flavoprotein (pyridoxamine 5'-phosphate oxidase superfamily)
LDGDNTWEDKMRRQDREVKDKAEIEDIIKQCKICHLAMVDEGMPYVVPLSYGYSFLDDNTLELYFHSAFEGRKLRILRKNNNVCFEISNEGEPVYAETPCNSGCYFSSVIGNGKVVFIENVAEKCKALSVMFKHQSGKDVVFNANQVESVCVYKVVSTDFTGKKKPRPNA